MKLGALAQPLTVLFGVVLQELMKLGALAQPLTVLLVLFYRS